jgi:CubicO group peptidase (beta-lactamase class C family)
MQTMSDEKFFTASDIETILRRADESDFSGTILIDAAGEPILSCSRGRRNIPDDLANGPDTLYGIASGTKLFTALGILKLAEQGEIDLDRSAADYLPAPSPYIAADATVRQLLCHTSGCYDYYDEETVEDFDNFTVDIPWSELETPTDYLPLFAGRSPKFPPGARCSYSNGGYVLLGVIIEEIASAPYRQVIEREILKPAGMARSGFFRFDALPPDTAAGYLKADGETRSNIYRLPVRGGGDGGMYASAQELSVFWRSLYSGSIIYPETVALAETVHSRLWDSLDYGLGMYLQQSGERRARFIIGADAGVGCSSRFYPELDLSIQVLSNRTEGNSPVMRAIMEILSREG